MTIITHIAPILVCLLPAAIWQWISTTGQSRGETFFGAHIEAGFRQSRSGQAIVKQFHRRLWSWCAVAAVASMLIPSAWAPLALSLGSLFSLSAGSIAFAMANRRTHREATVAVTSTVRIAFLTSETRNGTLWLGGLDWVSMLLPPLIPLGTVLILMLHWSEVRAEIHEWQVSSVILALIIGLMCTANQWALRYRARSRDWAPTPYASHKFRTYLGAMQALVFTFIIGQMCALLLIEFNNVVFVRRIAVLGSFKWTLPLLGSWLVCVWGMRVWLAKHMSLESSDPMSDSCWKWGYFYFNPGDPALVVPQRNGPLQSYNYARPSIWVAGGVLLAVLVLVLTESIWLLKDMKFNLA